MSAKSCALLFGLALGLAAPAAAQTPAPTVEAAKTYAFAFADADVASVADAVLGQSLHIPFTVDPSITAKITLRVDRRLTARQLLNVFEAALAIGDVAMVERDGRIDIVPRQKARGLAGIHPPSGGEAKGYDLVAEPVTYGSAVEIAKALDAIGPKGVVVFADDRLGILVLGGSEEERRVARQTIAQFDRSLLTDARLRVVSLTGSAERVGADLERLLKAANVTGVVLVPMRQTNSLVIVGRSEAVLDDVEAWVKRIDQPGADNGNSLWVYQPRNVRAESLAEALRALGSDSQDHPSEPPPQIAGDKAPSPEPARAGGTAASPDIGIGFDPDNFRVSVERSTNNLIVLASPSRWQSVRAVLAQLDKPPRQVLIEATVLEVTLNDDFAFGVDWSALSASSPFSASFSQSETGAVQPIFPGLSISYLNAGVKAVVNTLASRTRVEVVSAPKLVAVDNQTASLQVGDQVPIVIQKSQGTAAPGAPLVVTTEYRDTGVILQIKPRINGPDSVLVDLTQEVSGVVRNQTSGIDSPIIQQRKFASSLQIRTGQVIALGGLISSARTRGASGTPGLMDIPLIGALFKSDRRDNRRTELIVLLSARILDTPQDEDKALADLKASLQGIDRNGPPVAP